MAAVSSCGLGRRGGGFTEERHGRDPACDASAAFPATRAHGKSSRT
jgi:hypothetical protein